jgi:hypothetical protein
MVKPTEDPAVSTLRLILALGVTLARRGSLGPPVANQSHLPLPTSRKRPVANSASRASS